MPKQILISLKCVGISKWEIQLATSGYVGTWVREGVRVAEVVRRHEGPSPKSLDSNENFKP